MDEDYWCSVRTMRLRLAALVESLTIVELDRPSLCRGWRVRDVAGHVAVIPTLSTWRMMATAPRAGFNPNRINTLIARREGSRQPEEIVERLRRHADDRRTAKALDVRNSLFDIIVHAHDIARPLGRDFPVPAAIAELGLERVWAMGWPFNAKKRLGGYTLQATDSAWRVGAGPEVSGPGLALLLLLTGRTEAAMEDLHGPGVALIRG